MRKVREGEGMVMRGAESLFETGTSPSFKKCPRAGEMCLAFWPLSEELFLDMGSGRYLGARVRRRRRGDVK